MNSIRQLHIDSGYLKEQVYVIADTRIMSDITSFSPRSVNLFGKNFYIFLMIPTGALEINEIEI